VRDIAQAIAGFLRIDVVYGYLIIGSRSASSWRAY
jgi:hypothetical protein